VLSLIIAWSDILIDDCISCLQQLRAYSLEQLNSLWEEITGQTSVRMGYIKVLDSQLCSIENDRIKMVKQP